MWAGIGCVYERSEWKTTQDPHTSGAQRPIETDRAWAARATARGQGAGESALAPQAGARGLAASGGPTPRGNPRDHQRGAAPRPRHKHTRAHMQTPNGGTSYLGTLPSGGWGSSFLSWG